MIRFDGLPPEVVQAMCTPMHQVLPPSPTTGALYIGSMLAVNDRDMLRQHHITHIVQVLDVPWLPPSDKDGFICHRIDILDHPAADLRPHLDAACVNIDRALRSGASVLVHCQQGISRSSAVVIAFLIRNRGMSYDAAHAHVLRTRPCINPNPGFVRALHEWEALWRRPAVTRRFTS